MKWTRAFLSGVVIVAAAFALLVVIPDLILSEVTGVERVAESHSPQYGSASPSPDCFGGFVASRVAEII